MNNSNVRFKIAHWKAVERQETVRGQGDFGSGSALQSAFYLESKEYILFWDEFPDSASGSAIGQNIFCTKNHVFLPSKHHTASTTLVLFMNVTTRSRTGLFLSYRDSRAPSSKFRKFSTYDAPDSALDDEEQGLIASSNHAADIDLPPKWSAGSSCFCFRH